MIISMPRLGLNMEEGTILSWFVKAGDEFDEGEALCEIESEKTTSDLEAPCKGKVVNIIVEEDQSVEVGAPILEIEE